MAVLSPEQLAIYAEVSERLDEEGYGDLLTGQPEDVHDAVSQMELDARTSAMPEKPVGRG